MNTTANTPAFAPRPMRLAPEVLEGRVALRITAQLSRGSEALPHDLSERLRISRERAVAAARQQRQQRHAAAPASGLLALGGGQAALSGPPSLWLRLASALPLLVLLVGLVMIQHHHDQEQIAAAAEIDSALLADELPPQAYGDPGFSEYLRSHDAP